MDRAARADGEACRCRVITYLSRGACYRVGLTRLRVGGEHRRQNTRCNTIGSRVCAIFDLNINSATWSSRIRMAHIAAKQVCLNKFPFSCRVQLH